MFKKLCFVIIFVLLFSPCLAPSISAQVIVKFAWDPIPDPVNIAGYELYQSSESGIYNDAPIVTVPYDGCVNNICGAQIEVPYGKWFWIVKSYDFLERRSYPSNEVSFFADPNLPAIPQNFRKISTRLKIDIEVVY